ncbi:ribosome 60S biogenesis N-terminal-domain-containing protein [Mycena maculata]|uniref:Ribosome 60S biogenesis N-terminal-domain-containing protein n=1 Tax=Mycena maculata TaxID=230809 RepID=A0AAD7NYJ4_9AGAR|nr:ribosome 60S biogenesis N-terminal-domain-containing protein [Mycena maculata]
MSEPPTKRLKTEKRTFTSPDEIRTSLWTQNQDHLIQALTELRNQFSVWPNEGPISTQDVRLVLAQKWLNAVPGAHDLFALWEKSNARQPAVIVLILSLLSSLLALLSSHYTFHAAGHPILRTLLTPPWMRKLNSYLGGSHTELLLVTLKLFNSMSAFGGGRERKTILESFAWETKSLPKLLNMRRKIKADDSSDPLAKPDIRTLYILFCLSFVDQENPTQLKTMFLEQHKDAFFSIFRGLAQDPFAVIRKVLEICWAGIWLDQKIKRTLKIGLFSEITVAQLVKIYDRAVAEDSDPEHVPADLVHHFLLAICTRPGIGICFKDRGWYPRKSETETVPDEDELRSRDKGGKIYNKILSNILKTLKINEDLRQQELALKIMTACPELVAGFWSAAGLTLEPRLSSKWIANISFFGSVLTLPVPTESFLLSDNGVLYQPTPPPLAVVIENILPSVNTKAHLSKGLLQSSGLVQHCTALALCKCLTKYARVSQVFRSIEAALEEDKGDGQWAKMRRDLEREIRHRVPEFQVIVAFASAQKEGQPGAGKQAPHPTKIAFLAESAQRLLWMYHSCLPLLVAETRFDVGKLVQNFSEFESKPDDERDAPARLNAVRQLHVLRLLNESEQFVWSGKAAGSTKSHLHALLGAFSACQIPALRDTLKHLIVHLLSGSIVFQQNQGEPSLWLAALPVARDSATTTEMPDDVSLTDEAATVIGFLDDCIQRCLKTPYRYIEDMQAVYPETQSIRDDMPSPLIMTVLEQLGVKVASKQASPSDVFALATFMRKLVLRLSSVQNDLSFLHQVAAKLDEVLGLFNESPVISNAIRREMRIMRSCLPQTHVRRGQDPEHSGLSQLEGFLRQVGHRPIPDGSAGRITTAFEVVDWVRLVGVCTVSEIRTSSDVVTRLHLPALADLAESLDPDQKVLWDGLNITQDFTRLRRYLSFECLFIHSSVSDIVDESRREILTDVAFTDVPTLTDTKRVISLIGHSLAASMDTPALTSGLLFLVASIFRRTTLLLSSSDSLDLKEHIFVRCAVMSALCTRDVPDVVREGLRHLVDLVLDPTQDGDREIVSGITSHWLSVLTNLGSAEIPHGAISPWIRYMAAPDLFGLLQLFSEDQNSDSRLLEMVIAALGVAVKAQSVADLHSRLPLLTALWESLPKSSTLEAMIATIIDACVPVALSGRPDLSTSAVLMQCDATWSYRFHAVPSSLDLQSLLFREGSWSQSTVKILSAILYQSGCDSNMFSSWLATDFAARRPPNHLAQLLHVYLDAADSDVTQADAMAWIPHVFRFLQSVTDETAASSLREDCASCLCLIAARLPDSVSDLVAALDDRIRRLPETSLTRELLTIGNWLAKRPDPAQAVVTSLVDHGLQWCIHAFAVSDVDSTVQATVDELVVLVETARSAKAHIAETLLGVIIQNCLADISAIALLSAVLRTVPLKPLIVNRYIQSIVQHPQFFKVCATGAPRVPLRDQVIHALHILFNLHPTNTCQITHVQPLVRIYRGTSSTSDRMLLSIFQLFETQRKVSVASLLGQWSTTPEIPSSNILEAVQSLDAILVLRTCLHFPKWRCLGDQTYFAENSRDAQLYDPVFLILIFAQAMAEKIPDSAFGWIELFRTNIVSLLIRTLSAKDGYLREVARSQLAALWAHLETADMQEQPHVVYVLNVLRNLLPQPTAEPIRRLPSYTTLILLHALRGIFYPSNFIYPLTARFLLQRPTLDVTDVPMLYGMLYSSSDDWKKERGWIIRFISDGMMSTDDWRVLKRRHTWELLAGLFQSSEQDLALRNSILEVLANLTCNQQATTSLILKSSLLHWIEMQLLISTAEAVAWIKILENILLIVEAEKMESSTGGEWRFVICRCLSLILRDLARSLKPEVILSSAAPVIFRLSALPGPSPLGLTDLLDYCLSGLQLLEAPLDIPRSRTAVLRKAPLLDMPPHSGHELQAVADNDPLLTWGKSVEYLWQASMTLSVKPLVWDALTPRLLIWRSLVGEEGSSVGEWARKSTLEMLRM